MKIKFKLILMFFAITTIACGGQTSHNNQSVSTSVETTKKTHAPALPEDAERAGEELQGVRISVSPTDSLMVLTILNEAKTLKQKPDNWMLWTARKFMGKPYVAGVLDRTDDEELIVNLRNLDCTTYVEQVLALARCAANAKTTFNDFATELLHIRYVNGKCAYTARQHYFTVWINDNEKEGIVRDIHPNPPFTAVQTINIDWMTTHTASYKMLTAHPEWKSGIRNLEQSVNGKRYRYIPKSQIVNTRLMRETIHDGDIIVIITNKKGLDTTHIGLASWHSDGLHLINASAIHKKVVDEPMLLRTYMAKHPVQIGIRICRPIL